MGSFIFKLFFQHKEEETMKKYIWGSIPLAVMFLVILSAFFLNPAQAQTIDPYYAGSYSLVNLGSITDLPTPYGGLVFKYNDPNTIIIGGAANRSDGKLYSVGVTRGTDNHITEFSGGAVLFADGAYNDGGVVYGPDNVLFLARWHVYEMGQTKPGSTITDKIIDLTTLPGLPATPSPGGLMFVPAGFPGAGQLKVVSYDDSRWYTFGYAPDGSGTYNITSATYVITISGGPEGIFYVPSGSPLFTVPSVLVSEYGADKVGAYQIDANGDPIPATRRDFIIDLNGAEGAAIDPLTGDFLFSTFGGANQVIVIRGFEKPIPPTHLYLPSIFIFK
jgi:hypothetical protein